MKNGQLWFGVWLVLILTPILKCQETPSGVGPKEIRLQFKRHRAVAKSRIGGESHDHYSIALESHRVIVITLRSVGNAAEFMLSGQPQFQQAEPLRAGSMDESKRQWTGSVPESGIYHIYVTAHPISKYRLEIESR